jgi:putative transposase
MADLLEELAGQVGVTGACAALSVPRSWYYRQRAEPAARNERASQRPTPASALSEAEKADVRAVLGSPRFCEQTPREVYATLLDEGEHLCHWRTMYRILAEQGEKRDRRRQRRHPIYAKPELVARAPNQVWSWDITYLAGRGRRCFYYLYVVLDIYSRYVVGWMIASAESSWWAHELIAATCAKQGILPEQLTLHSDRGSPMKASSVADLLARLGVSQSHGRPHTPNDNPFSEAQFKTLKYQPTFPAEFADIERARAWGRDFFHWYNQEHHHVALGLMTPAVVHLGQAEAVAARRQQVLDQAYERHPERFVRGRPQVAPLPEAVWINQPEETAFSALASEVSQPATQPGSRNGRIVLEAGKQPATIGETLEPLREVKCFPLVNSELSQSP